MVPVTFLLPVYNGEKYLAETLQSISNQTFQDFETLIINDGSTDGTQKIIDEFSKRDGRIRCITRENCGLIATLNEGLDRIESKYITRIDADDLCHRQRLELQIQYMEANPQIGVSGTYLRFFGDDDFEFRYPVQSEELKANIIFRPPFGHPSVIMRKDLISRNNLYYDADFVDCEDYKLWLDMMEFTEFGNIPYSLLFYRKHGESISDRSQIQEEGSQRIRQIAIRKAGISPEIIPFHLDLCTRSYDRIELEYWPVYLWELKKKGHFYLKAGFGNLKTFCDLYLPKEMAEEFYNCVHAAVLDQSVLTANT